MTAITDVPPFRTSVNAAVKWVFADASARTNFTKPFRGPTFDKTKDKDIGSIAWQLDNDSFWCLSSRKPLTWVSVSGGAASIDYAETADLLPVGTANDQGVSVEIPRADHVHAHGTQTVDTLHALASNSANGFMPKVDERFFSGAGLYRDIVNDDFDTGGAYTTGAAAVPTTVNFGTAQWRCGLSGSGAAITYVTTNADTTHSGIVQVETGTTTTGAAGGIRAASGALAARFFGSGQNWEQDWLVRIPTLSTVSEEYILRFGWNAAHTGLATDGVYFEYDRLTSTNWRGVARSASSNTVASGGSNVAVAAGSWIHLRITWDGTTLTFSVDGTVIGTVTTGIPTAGVAEDNHIVKSAGTTTRTYLLDKYHHDLAYTTPRAA